VCYTHHKVCACVGGKIRGTGRVRWHVIQPDRDHPRGTEELAHLLADAESPSRPHDEVGGVSHSHHKVRACVGEKSGAQDA